MIKRHHPVTVIYKLYRKIRYSIVPLAALLFNEIRAGTGRQPYWVYYAAAAYGAALSLWSVLSWYRETYRLDSETLHLVEGVFTVKQRTIPLSKINNIRIGQSWVYRLLGIADVELQTRDSNAHADARLVISGKMAERLKLAIGNAEPEVGTVRVADPVRPEHRVTPKDILMLSLSSNTFWLGVPVLLTVLQYVLRWIEPPEEQNQTGLIKLFAKETWVGFTFDEAVELIVALLAITGGCAILSWLIAVAMMQIRYRGWHLSRTGDDLSIRHGWTDRNAIQIRTQRIQALRIKELMIGRLFGYVSICVDCVGYRGDRRKKLLIPAIRKAEMPEVLGKLVPEFRLATPLRDLHRSAGYGPAILAAAVLTMGIAVGCFFSGWSLAAIPLVYVAYAYNRYIYKRSKWDKDRNLLIWRKGGLNRTTVYLRRAATESVSVRQSRWQRLWDVYRVKMDIDSPANAREYAITGLPRQACEEILGWYKNKPAADFIRQP